MKILAIGNSFSKDATRYLHQIAAADGLDLKIVNLCIGGCSLETHSNNVRNNEQPYGLEINGAPMGRNILLHDAIHLDTWDIVTMQQVSYMSPDYETYQPYLKELSDFVTRCAPQAKQVIHQTWAYEQDSEKLHNAGYRQQADMFADIKTAYEQARKDLGDVQLIPAGTAFQKALDYGFKALFQDTFHASLGAGRYLLAAVWFEYLTGRSVINNTFAALDEEQPEEIMALLQRCAHETVKAAS